MLYAYHPHCGCPLPVTDNGEEHPGAIDVGLQGASMSKRLIAVCFVGAGIDIMQVMDDLSSGRV